MVFSSAGFVGTGLLISEMVRNRRIVLKHVEELEDQVKLRRDLEEQLRSLVESSPAAIVTIDSDGKVVLANEAAHQLLAPRGPRLQGQATRCYLPALQTVLKTQSSRAFRTTLQCTGKRSDGEVFLAGVWFSTYSTLSGPRLAAIVVDLSEDLRNREELSLDHLLKNTRILMSTVAREIRNLSGAILVVHKNLSRVKELETNEDFRALGGLLQSLERIASPSEDNNAKKKRGKPWFVRRLVGATPRLGLPMAPLLRCSAATPAARRAAPPSTPGCCTRPTLFVGRLPRSESLGGDRWRCWERPTSEGCSLWAAKDQ